MADDILPPATARFIAATAPDPDETLREMDAYAREQEFPHVGPEVGGFLRVLARLRGAERAFEFGSGFGYSAYWLAGGLADGGTVVLTDFDADNLATARSFFEAGDLADRAVFEAGDALDVVDEYDGPFDVVVLDTANEPYVEAFEAVRDKVADGGVVVADNAMTGRVVEFDHLVAYFDGEEPDMGSSTRGIAEYLTHVRADPAFETVVLPLGDGVAVSAKR